MDSEHDPAELDPRQERKDAFAESAQMREDMQEIRSVRHHLYFVAIICLIGTAVVSAEAWSGQESEASRLKP